MFPLRSGSKWFPLVVAGVLAFTAASCGDNQDSWTPPPTAVVTPPPSTLPPMSGGSGSSGCALGAGDPDAVCERTVPQMMHFIDAAIGTVVAEKPHLFDLKVEKGEMTGQYKVLNKEVYIDSVVEALRKMGLCAQRGDYDYEVVEVKQDNELSEEYDIYLSDGHIRRGGGSYRETCIPAAFPVERPADAPPQGSGCGRPFPPPISRVKIKDQYKNDDFWTLNGTPMVGPDVQYCAEIGFTDGRALCPVRPEGHPERIACETWAVGEALDTGRVGPTWYLDGEFCTGPESGCQNADNQYLLWAYESGQYSACASNGACGYFDLNKETY